MNEKHKFLLQQLAIGAVVLFVLALGGLAVREATKKPAGNPPVTTIEGETEYRAPTQAEMDKKLADLKDKTDETVAAAKDKTEDHFTKVNPPTDGLLIQYAGLYPNKTQVGYAFYYPEKKASYLDQHKLFCDHFNDMCVALGAVQSGGIWIPRKADGHIGRPTKFWEACYNFDEAKSELKNIPIEVRIEKGIATVTTHVDCTQEHRKLMEPALRKLAKAAGHPVSDKAEWRRETDKQWFLFSHPDNVQN